MIALFRVLLLLAVVAVISDMASGLRRSRTQSSYPFKEGDKVQVEYNGAWWNATVMYYADAGINISYDVGQGETIPSAQICDRVRNASENETQSSAFALGSRVEVNFERKGGYYPGSIATVHEDSTYDINYDDGDNEIGVHLDFIRVSQSHERRESNARSMKIMRPTVQLQKKMRLQPPVVESGGVHFLYLNSVINSTLPSHHLLLVCLVEAVPISRSIRDREIKLRTWPLMTMIMRA